MPIPLMVTRGSQGSQQKLLSYRLNLAQGDCSAFRILFSLPLFSFPFETRSLYVAHTGLGLAISLPQALVPSHYKWAPPLLASIRDPKSSVGIETEWLVTDLEECAAFMKSLPGKLLEDSYPPHL